ncbi:NAD-dependent epimerase/dehydratase family protein [Persicimonas caeni]|uniref:NAD-dependent epimerase/dehydratase family protein n=1 Tax=Persicimonas caeni TaxID=2292766 RepID=A0A4Y6PZK9_PERCE|nr:NAD-dependent epimerase/dehydratase family protein [Persicimonas caeni]QDG53185.1 NAD-dependent epimerase/dehydratase family protein [Persicimonas caeni]QED34407.1 NAD-dependent epimerase/dehydratase family protein [Persicimonas caeni]
MADKPKILVLGATGFLGAHIARTLAERGYPVRATKRASSKTWHVADVDVEWVEADLDDPQSLDGALGGCLGVIHSAGFYPRDGLDVDAARRRGVDQLRNLLDACSRHRIPRIVYVSSPATLGVGEGPEAVLDEDDQYVPGTVANAYYESKWAMEAELYRYLRRGVPAVITIPGAVFGPGDIKPSTGEFLLAVARGKLPAVVGDVLNAVDVRDAADSIVNALERGRPGRRYILGGENLDVDRFVELVGELAGVDKPRFHLPATPVRHLARLTERLGRKVGVDVPPMVVGVELAAFSRKLCSDRARAELGHESRALRNTLADALAWFREHDYLVT